MCACRMGVGHRREVYWKAGAASDAEEDLTAEVVAHVKSVVRFPGMADFQYVSCDTRPLQEQVDNSVSSTFTA